METKIASIIIAVLLLAGCALFQNDLDNYDTELARLETIWTDLNVMFSELVTILEDQQITNAEFTRLAQMQGTVEAYKLEVEEIAEKIKASATENSARITVIIDAILRLIGKLT